MGAAGKYEVTRAQKFAWLKIICDYQHYVPISLPLDVDIDSVNASDVLNTFW
jgi:hypothetical protein